MLTLAGPINSGLSAGGAGVSTANANSPHVLTGRVMGVYVKYNETPPGTCDVTIVTIGDRHPATTILTRTNSATSGWFYPNLQVHDTAGSAIAGEYQGILISDIINVKIEQANDGDHVDVWLILGDL